MNAPSFARSAEPRGTGPPGVKVAGRCDDVESRKRWARGAGVECLTGAATSMSPTPIDHAATAHKTLLFSDPACYQTTISDLRSHCRTPS